MKKILLSVMLLVVCINLISCGVLSALRYSISGDIIDPVGDFSRGTDKGTLVFGGKKYILIDELCGSFEFDIIDGDVHLGQTSNFPFFPNSCYYANTAENPDYIMCGTNSYAVDVFLREDLCQTSLCYVLQNADVEINLSSAFVATKEVSYKKHLEGKEYYGTSIYVYIKDYPRLTLCIRLCKINEKWYHIKYDGAFALSETFVDVLAENELLP